jgi:hypothetical protein
MPKTQSAANTETQPTAPTLSPAREMLKKSLEAETRAISLAAKAQQVLTAAAAEFEQALVNAGKYTNVDEDALASRLAALKGEKVAKTPDEIRAARHQRIAANEEAHACNLVLQAAQREHEQADDDFSRAEKVCASHCTNILGECATNVIAKWDAINAERETLKTTLSALILANINLDVLPQEQRLNILKGAAS